MLVEDRKQYCWITPDGIGGPEDSVEQAVKSYLELHRTDNDDIVIGIGHPSFYIPDIDGDAVIGLYATSIILFIISEVQND